MNLANAQSFFSLPDKVTGLEIYSSDPHNVRALRAAQSLIAAKTCAL